MTVRQAPSRTFGQSRDPEFDAISEKNIFDEAKDRLHISSTAEVDNRNHAKAAMRFREGDQWDDSPATSQSMDQPELVINLMDALKRSVGQPGRGSTKVAPDSAPKKSAKPPPTRRKTS